MFSRRNVLVVFFALLAAGLGVWSARAALTQVTAVVTIDETDPAGFTNPVDDDCPLGAPCKVKSDLNVADSNQPAASVTTISPLDFIGPPGTSIPNGTVVGNTHVYMRWAAIGGCSLAIPVEDTQNLVDGGIKGEVSDDNTAGALANTGVWPTRLESDLRVSQLLTSGHPVVRRSVAVLSGPLGLGNIPINVLAFAVADGNGFGGLALVGTYSVVVAGDPTSPPPGQMCTPMSSNSILLGKTAAGLTLLECQTEGTHTLTTVLTREVTGSIVFDATVSDTVQCSLPVGGVQGLPEPDAAAAGSGSPLPGAPLAAGAAVGGLLLLAGGAWYVRRRRFS